MEFEDLFEHGIAEDGYRSAIKDNFRAISWNSSSYIIYAEYIPEDVDFDGVAVRRILFAPRPNNDFETILAVEKLGSDGYWKYCEICNMPLCKNVSLKKLYFEAVKNYERNITSNLTDEEKLLWELS